MSSSMDNPHYSPTTGLIYIFNLIVGTGALTLPAAFYDAGWGLGTGVLILLALISYMTTTFVIESMAAANAMIHFKRVQRLKKSEGTVDINDDTSSDYQIVQQPGISNFGNRSSPVRNGEREPLISSSEMEIEEDFEHDPVVRNRRESEAVYGSSRFVLRFTIHHYDYLLKSWK